MLSFLLAITASILHAGQGFGDEKAPTAGIPRHQSLEFLDEAMIEAQMQLIRDLEVNHRLIINVASNVRPVRSFRQEKSTDGPVYVAGVDDLYEILSGAKLKQPRAGLIPALQHPEFETALADIHSNGYRLVLDVTLNFRNTRTVGAHSDVLKLIRIAPHTKWATLIHEMQHMDFDFYIAPYLQEARLAVRQGQSIKVALPSKALERYSAQEIQEIENYLRADAPSLAINERLSGMRQMDVVGFERGSKGAPRFRYSDQYMRRFLLRRLKYGELTEMQKIIWRQIEQREKMDQIIRTGGSPGQIFCTDVHSK
ncbi:MAG: hypothetical protein C5B49_14935 [Bdellovibrio sp.]|nr:MAG: hypothetical protein C5B49_14935 [Bdellovibrio sp.]